MPAGRRWVLVASILGTSLVLLDGTVVNVALPRVIEALGATVVDAQWVVEIYQVALSALVLVGGALGDRYGRRRIFMLGTAVFAGASTVCGLAPSVEVLIAARAVQGIGGALLVPGSLALLTACYGEEERGAAIGTWSGATTLAAAIGPLLGGFLAETVSWRWIFLLNAPPALALLAISRWRVPESRDDDAPRHLDLAGALLASVGLAGLVYGLIESSRLGFGHPAVIGGLAAGALGFAAFLVVEARSPSPMVPLSVFRSRTFLAVNILTLLLYAALGGTLFFFPFDLIQTQGYSAIGAGAALLPFILLMMVLSPWAGGLVARHGARPPLVVGPAIAAVGLGLLAWPGVGGSYWTTFFPGITVLGLGMAITVAPLTTAVMGALEVRRAGLASGINNAVASTGSLLAVAVFGLILVGGFVGGLDRAAAARELSPSVHAALVDQRLALADAKLPASLSPGEEARAHRVVGRAFVSGFRRVALGCAGLALASALLGGLFVPRRVSGPKPRDGEAS